MELLTQASKSILHRLLLIYIYTGYIIYNRLSQLIHRISQAITYRQRPLLSITTAAAKIPNHLLVIVDRPNAKTIDYATWVHGFLIDCWSICEEYGIGSLTLMDSVNGSSVLLMELVKLVERKPITLYCNHKPVTTVSSSVDRSGSSLQVNVITENQRQFFVRQLSTIAAEEPHFRFSGETLLPKMTRFPMVDLVVSVQESLKLQSLLPSQIGFAEFCHFPGEPLGMAAFRKALKGYSQCRQNFGK